MRKPEGKELQEKGENDMFHVMQCGYRYTHREPLSIDRTGLPFYVFVYFRTPALAGAEGAETAVQGKYVLFPPGMPHRYHSDGVPYENDWIHFTAEDGDPLLAELAVPTGRAVQPIDPSPISRCTATLQELMARRDSWAKRLASSELECMFYELSRQAVFSQSQTAHRYYTELSRLRASLFSRPAAGTTVESLAAQIGLSGSYLQSIYKAQFGVPIGSDIILGRITRAKYMLLNSGSSISAIAEASGYRCDEHFIRQFKRMTGVTPGEFRRRGHS